MNLFVIISFDLQSYVLDTQVKRGAELSTNHQLVISWSHRPVRPKPIVRVCWEDLVEPSAREVFHIRKSFCKITRKAEDIESKWTMFPASITDVAALSCESKLSGARHGGKSWTWWFIIFMDRISWHSQYGPAYIGSFYWQVWSSWEDN